MSWSRGWSSALVLSLCLLLPSCGFSPIYANNHMSVADAPDIEIVSIPDRDGQYLRNLLIDRLYLHDRPADARYELKFTPLGKTTVNIGIQKDATATRGQMQITTQMRLVEKATGHVMLDRRLNNVGAYNLLDNQLATLVSEKNITESILQEMGDDVVTELNLYFRRISTP